MDAEKRESKLIVESMPRIMLRGHYDVFISYRRLDGKSYARLVYNELTRRGFRCFFDFERIERGEFETKIKDAIDRSDYVLPILTPRMFDEGSWTAREVKYALSLKRDNLVPVYPGDFHSRQLKAEDAEQSQFPFPVPEEFSSLRQIHFQELDVGVNFDHSMDKIAHAVSTFRVALRRKRGLLVQLTVVLALGFAVWTQLRARQSDVELRSELQQKLSQVKEQYQGVLAKANAETEKRSAEMSAATNTVYKLEGLVKTLRSEVSDLRAESDDDRKNLAAARQQVAELERMKARLEGEVRLLAAATNRLVSAEQACTDMERKSSALEERIKKVQDELEGKQEECETLKEKLDIEKEKYRKLLVEYLKLTKE